jgi:hypothetical protein
MINEKSPSYILNMIETEKSHMTCICEKKQIKKQIDENENDLKNNQLKLNELTEQLHQLIEKF